jgi:hypothetical protein
MPTADGVLVGKTDPARNVLILMPPLIINAKEIDWLIASVGILCAVLGGTPAAAVEPDWSGYDQLLQQYVARGTTAAVELNQVDYSGLARDPLFAAVVAELAEFPLQRLESHEETLAFYINAYNILALKMVIDNLPVDSIKDVGNVFKSVWKHDAGFIGGETVTLDNIEHERLRKMNEPRMHLAIVCASVSCPDLRTEAYRADRLEMQLEAQCTEFLHNPGKGLRRSGENAAVSKIFKWFAEDFEVSGGVATFVRRYHPLPDGVTLRPSLDYNWSLNGR